MQKDLKTQSLITSILFIAVLVAGYLVTMPTWNKLSKSRAELARAELDKQNLLNAQADLEAFLKKFSELGDEAKIAGKALPAEPQFAALLGSIEELSKLSGFALASANINENPDANTTNLGVNSVVPNDLQINGSGSYASVKDFVDRLQSHLRLIDVQALSLELDDAGNLEVQMKVRTYYQR